MDNTKQKGDAFDKFRDERYLMENEPLSASNVLEYFYRSSFYDPNSINQQRRRGEDVPPGTIGIEYVLRTVNAAGHNRGPQLPFGQTLGNQFGAFTIQKIQRSSSPTDLGSPQEVYYVLGGTIFRAPSLGDVVRRRLVAAVKELNDYLDTMIESYDWCLLRGYYRQGESFKPPSRDDVIASMAPTPVNHPTLVNHPTPHRLTKKKKSKG
eukprot:GHVN01071469.1.p1 GENE.GHVN01071469.1~~GHVN01071469.1.p1  ORF type:complete len:228 (-),score=35.88 GHVN01071469.1:181-807(-)